VTIPSFPSEGGGKTIHVMVNDAGGTLQTALFSAVYIETVDGERIGPLAISGYVEDGEAAVAPPVVGAGVYTSSPSARDSGDVVTLLVDACGRQQVIGAAAENAAATGNPVLIGGRYDSAPRTLDNGDTGAIALDAAGNVLCSIVSPVASTPNNGKASGSSGIGHVLLSSRTRRYFFAVSNTGSAVVYLTFGLSFVADTGVCIQPGETFKMDGNYIYPGEVRLSSNDSWSVSYVEVY